VAALVDSSPTTLDTLNELAAALGNDPNFATTVSQQIGTKLNASAYTAADVLAKLLSVDGTGSNLDADRLDGRHASQFQWAKVTDDAGRGRHPGVDWNAPTTSGFYDGSNLNHATPFKTHTWQYVIQASHRNGDNYQFQLAADFDSGGNLSARVKKAGNWDTWHKIWTDKDFDPNQFATKIESVTIPTLSWPGNKIYVGQSVEIRITNYDSDTPYRPSAFLLKAALSHPALPPLKAVMPACPPR
jgi:hypothetical protein